MVGTKGGTACKHAHAFVSAKPRRTYGRRPTFLSRCRKIEQNPKMGKPFDFPNRFFACIRRIKHHASRERRSSTALARYAEFFSKIRADISDRRNNCFHISYYTTNEILCQPHICIGFIQKRHVYAIFYTFIHFIQKIFK